MKNTQRGSTEALAQLIVAMIFIIIFGAGSLIYQTATRETRTVTIEDKMERCKDRDDCKYLIFTDKGVLQNTDSLWNWKWESSDYYSNLKIGKTYDIETTGLRIGFLSWYPNIVKMKEVRNDQLSW